MRGLRYFISALLALAFFGVGVRADTISWNFTDDDALFDSASPDNPPLHYTVSAISIANSVGTVSDFVNPSSPSTGDYPGASGSGNVGNAVKIGSLNLSTSSYYALTITPDAGFKITVSDLDFAARSTGTGPTNYSLRSSADNYAGVIMGGSVANNSVWVVKNNTFNSSVTSATELTLRLYTYNGTGSPTSGTINNRLDDIALAVSAEAIPVPLPRAAIAGATLLPLAALWSLRRSVESREAVH